MSLAGDPTGAQRGGASPDAARVARLPASHGRLSGPAVARRAGAARAACGCVVAGPVGAATGHQ